MDISGVKRKFPFAIVVFVLALLTSFISWTGIVPSNLIEKIYARELFPIISHIASFFADAVPFSWLDVWIAASVVVLIFSVRRRSWQLPLAAISVGYLVFFWGWGLNYHRTPLEARLGVENLPAPHPEMLNWFAIETTVSLNRLWPIVAAANSRAESDDAVASRAAARVRHVLGLIDGKDWVSAVRIKHTLLADWWFRISGIDGVFNPFAHEPILTSGIPDFQRPFLMAHELAHVHGVADEGDANFIAYLATVESDDPGFQYSGAFQMWLHLYGNAAMLDPGPRQDLRTLYERNRSQEIPQAIRLQSAILDTHLKANGVHDGLQSYSRFVRLAIALRSRQPDFH